mgnify:CR=1 FL=1
MTTKQAVDRGLELRREIASLEAEAKVCDEVLRAAALQGEQVELVDADREGRQFFARGSSAVVPVVLTSDLIMQSFADGSPAHARLEAAAGDRLGKFYRAVTTWKLLARSGKALRMEAALELGDRAAEFVAAAVVRDKYGVPRSNIKVEWERAEEVQP